MTYRLFDGYSMTFSDQREDGAVMRRAPVDASNGIPIWEGDIISDGRHKGVVEYDEFTFRFGIRNGREMRVLLSETDYTVLGNAFEHPDKV